MDKKEKLFLKLIYRFQWKYDLNKYPKSLFGFKNDNCLFGIESFDDLNQKKIITSYRFGLEQDLKNTRFILSHTHIWSFFEDEPEFYNSYEEVEYFMNCMLRKYLKMNGAEISCESLTRFLVAEAHFKKTSKY